MVRRTSRRSRTSSWPSSPQECRDVIIQTITKTGGHLASNLGVVELTLALHRAFDSPRGPARLGHVQPVLHPQARHRAPGPLSVDPDAGRPIRLRRADRERPRHPRRRPRRHRPLLRARHVDRHPGRSGRPVRRRHRRRRLADLGAELRGAQQHRPRQAQAPHRHLQRQRLVDLRERRLARPLAQPVRAPPDVPEVHRRRPQLLQAAAARATRPGSSRGRSRARSRASSSRT